MKKHPLNTLLFALLTVISNVTSSQSLSINTDGSNADTSAILELKSTNKGFLMPRMTQGQRSTLYLPAPGLLIFQTDGVKGFYYNGGTAVAPVWLLLTNQTTGWQTTGNAGINPVTNFIGTTDNQPLVFKQNNQSAGKIDGTNNTYFGIDAGLNNTFGFRNTVFGYAAMYWNTLGIENTAVGFASLVVNTTGQENTSMGSETMAGNTTGSGNSAFGKKAMAANTTASNNAAFGYLSMQFNTTGFSNSAFGSYAFNSNTTGIRNTGLGHGSLFKNTTGNHNTASGHLALWGNTTGSNNTANGFDCLRESTTGNNNSAFGTNALLSNISGSDNVAIGAFADVAAGNLTNATAIGSGAIVNASNKIRLGDGAVTIIEGAVAYSFPSDGRYKYNVLEDVKGLEFILKLRPVSYQFDAKKLDEQMDNKHKNNGSHYIHASYNEANSIRRTGFIAQEVEKASLEIGYSFPGLNKPKNGIEHYSLSYESFIMPLVKAVQEQQQQIDRLSKENEELKKLKEQIDILSKKVEILSGNPKKQ